MFNNIVLDITIGLIFVFLLYSLLATTIQEFLALIFAYRHRMLEKGIEQMLDGKNFSYYWWDKALNLLRWLFTSTKTLQRRIFPVEKAAVSSNKAIKGDAPRDKDEDSEQPVVADKTLLRKTFLSNAMINTQSAFAPAKPATYVKRVKLNKKASLFAASIINHPLYRRKSEHSLLFKKPAYLEAGAFSDIMIDVLSNRKSMGSSSPVQMQEIKDFIDANLASFPDLKSILNLFIAQAGDDVQQFRLLLEKWFNESMERVSGWYKRQATKILFAIGLALAFTFNVSTIEIINGLSVNKDLREAMAQSAAAYVKQRSADAAAGEQGDVAKVNADAKAQLADIERLYKDSIASVNGLLGLGWDSAIVRKDMSHGKINSSALGPVNRWLQSWWPTPVFNSYHAALAVLSDTFGRPMKMIGFLITALAITLGAPFWFDLLNRFVNVRAGGNNPREKEKEARKVIARTVVVNRQPGTDPPRRE